MIRLYTDWLWFGEVGYRAVYWTRLTDKALLGLIAGLAFFAIVYVNLWIARRFTPPVLGQYDARTIRTQFGDIARKGFGWLIFGCTLVISVFVAMEATTHWINYAMFTHPTPFGSVDPIFHRDIGFYIFKLNFLQYIYGWLMFTLVVAMIATALVSYAERAIEFLAGRADLRSTCEGASIPPFCGHTPRESVGVHAGCLQPALFRVRGSIRRWIHGYTCTAGGPSDSRRSGGHCRDTVADQYKTAWCCTPRDSPDRAGRSFHHRWRHIPCDRTVVRSDAERDRTAKA